tara:strand:+ start:812 stop:1126 length:315 start_codon:yes stop_codon:yes gene_type:complete
MDNIMLLAIVFLIIGFSLLKMFLTSMFFVIIVLYLLIKTYIVDSAEEPTVCCMAQTAACIACTQGITPEQYCETNPGATGCPFESSQGGDGCWQGTGMGCGGTL